MDWFTRRQLIALLVMFVGLVLITGFLGLRTYVFPPAQTCPETSLQEAHTAALKERRLLISRCLKQTAEHNPNAITECSVMAITVIPLP